MDATALFTGLYRSFNERDIDAVLAVMADDVVWPNGWEGGVVHGKPAIRDYWTRQFAAIVPQLRVIDVTAVGDSVDVVVDQTVRSLEGNLIARDRLTHRYAMRDGLVIGMTIHHHDKSESAA